MEPYLIPTAPGEAEFQEKRSTFLGHVRPVETEDEAKAFVTAMKKQYHDARHNCWCYLLRGGVERYSDDGEPQGTAGIPMLEVFRREGVTNAVCVVTRYFGGILLGTGGLLRAYTKSAKDALEAAGVSAVRRWVRVEAPCPYALLERVKTAVTAADGIISDLEYGADVTIRALLPEECTEAFQAQVRDLSAGAVAVTVTGEDFRAVPVR